ncbi:SGNH/GDSL hydrolase family protein [Methylorubrum sp. SB2]|uniref:SGNH/GDSL hydrolase family protein n=1 Tax=Methylorubrum subtropicum TaxID=3138812 RepID=UPI00313E8644
MSPTRARILAVTSGAVLLAGLGGAIGHAVASRAGGSKLRAYAEGRAGVVAAQSGSLADGFVMLAGDSHAELALPEPFSCGRRVLNAGVSGAKAEDYLAFLDALHLKHRPAVVVVTLGTNHLLRKRNPSTRETGDRYEADLAAIVTRLSGMADRVVLAAVPPLAATADGFDSAGVAELTKRQAAVCARLGCETADPYRSYRGEDFGIARPETTTDGVHLTEYATAYRAIDGPICR